MKFPDQFRVQPVGFQSDPGATYGVFIVPSGADRLWCVVTDGDPAGLPLARWEHVSVTVRNRRGVQLHRCPTWEQMCLIKDTFWEAEETVMQLHPPRSTYVDQHPYCLHLWRPVEPGSVIPLPPQIFV